MQNSPSPQTNCMIASKQQAQYFIPIHPRTPSTGTVDSTSISTHQHEFSAAMYFEARPGIFPLIANPKSGPESEHPKGTDAVPIEAIFQLNHAKSVGGDSPLTILICIQIKSLIPAFRHSRHLKLGQHISRCNFHHHPLIIRIPGNRTTREAR